MDWLKEIYAALDRKMPNNAVLLAKNGRELKKTNPQLAACKQATRAAGRHKKRVTLPALKCLEPKEGN